MGAGASLRTSLSINALRACVYIYIRQLSNFRAPTLWFIDVTVATCHIQYAFLSLCRFFPRENGQNMKILEVRHFMILKWPPKVTRRAKHCLFSVFFVLFCFLHRQLLVLQKLLRSDKKFADYIKVCTYQVLHPLGCYWGQLHWISDVLLNRLTGVRPKI